MSNVQETAAEPSGQLAIRTLAMPADTNPNGDIFGGWLVSQMDLAGLSIIAHRANCRITTVAIDSMSFLQPVHVGDFVGCYAELLKVGRSSMQIKIEVWATGCGEKESRKVTQGIFTYVAIDDEGKPQPVSR